MEVFKFPPFVPIQFDCIKVNILYLRNCNYKLVLLSVPMAQWDFEFRLAFSRVRFVYQPSLPADRACFDHPHPTISIMAISCLCGSRCSQSMMSTCDSCCPPPQILAIYARRRIIKKNDEQLKPCVSSSLQLAKDVEHTVF